MLLTHSQTVHHIRHMRSLIPFFTIPVCANAYRPTLSNRASHMTHEVTHCILHHSCVRKCLLPNGLKTCVYLTHNAAQEQHMSCRCRQHMPSKTTRVKREGTHAYQTALAPHCRCRVEGEGGWREASGVGETDAGTKWGERRERDDERGCNLRTMHLASNMRLIA